MQALQSLERDHQLLWSLTEALGAYMSALEAQRPLRAGDLTALVNALRTLADYRHFEKEEEVLVPVLVRHGFDYNLEILEDARREHDQLRYLIEVLHQAAARELAWSLDERRRIAHAARTLVESQRRIAAQQEVELYPEVVTRLEPPVLGQLTEKLCQFDQKSAARWPTIDVAALSRDVLARYPATLPSPQ